MLFIVSLEKSKPKPKQTKKKTHKAHTFSLNTNNVKSYSDFIPILIYLYILLVYVKNQWIRS